MNHIRPRIIDTTEDASFPLALFTATVAVGLVIGVATGTITFIICAICTF